MLTIAWGFPPYHAMVTAHPGLSAVAVAGEIMRMIRCQHLVVRHATDPWWPFARQVAELSQ